MAATRRRGRNAPTASPPAGSATLSDDGDDNSSEGGAANNPNPDSAPAPVVTISAADFQVIQQRIANLEAAQQNPRRRRRSDSESDEERAPKRSHLKGKTPDEYWGENHQELDMFIRQCEQNFRIDKCTEDETRVAFAGSYCRGTPQTQWEEYEKRPEHREPHVITWDDMKKELRRQLGEEHVYIDEMYDKWHRATQGPSQTGKQFGAYLQSLRTNLLDIDSVGAPNETQLIHRMRQGLRTEIRAALYRNPAVPKDWPTFLEAVARAESSLHLEHKSTSHASKHASHNKETHAGKPTESNNGHSNSHNSRGTSTRGNSQGQSRGRGGRGGHRGGRVSNNGTPASGVNNISHSNPGDRSKDTCFNCNKVGHWSNECPDLTPKN